MDLELLKKFYLVAEIRSITGATKKLNTSQSALSRCVNTFEYRVKDQLLIRTTRGIELTAQGKRLYEFAKKIVHDANVFEKSFHEK